MNISDLRGFVDAYAIAVRAGLITPCLLDENKMREKFGFDKAPKEVESDWEKTEGVRKPNTLKSSPEEAGELVEAEQAGADK